jgi:hypothetical protein
MGDPTFLLLYLIYLMPLEFKALRLMRLLVAIGIAKPDKILYHVSSSEMFDNVG